MMQLRLEGRSYQYIALIAGVTRQCVQKSISPPKEIRDFILRKYNGFCSSCGLYVGRSGHIHHDPSNTEEDYKDVNNLVLLCPSCHSSKHKDILGLRKKTDRDERLYSYHLARPNMTLDALAGMFHLKSRQHVFTIIKRLKGVWDGKT